MNLKRILRVSYPLLDKPNKSTVCRQFAPIKHLDAAAGLDPAIASRHRSRQVIVGLES